MRVIQLEDYKISVDCSFLLSPRRTVVNTINAYSWVVAERDSEFKTALLNSDILVPDGIAIVWAAKVLKGEKIKKISGADVHAMLLSELNKVGGKCFYLGAQPETLAKIRAKLAMEYPQIKVETYSPPYKAQFSFEDNQQMYHAINEFEPDVLFIGMTAPKQEKWVEENKSFLNAKIICSIGAVFDFYSGNKKRPPLWMRNLGLEWFGRLLMEPKRLWKRYLVWTPRFIGLVYKYKRKAQNRKD